MIPKFMPINSKVNPDKKYIIFPKSDLKNKAPLAVLSYYYGPQVNLKSKLTIAKDQESTLDEETQKLSLIVADCANPKFQDAFHNSYSSMISYIKDFGLNCNKFVIYAMTNLTQKSPNWDNICDLPENEKVEGAV
jgi:hypothetical protein